MFPYLKALFRHCLLHPRKNKIFVSTGAILRLWVWNQENPILTDKSSWVCATASCCLYWSINSSFWLAVIVDASIILCVPIKSQSRYGWKMIHNKNELIHDLFNRLFILNAGPTNIRTRRFFLYTHYIRVSALDEPVWNTITAYLFLACILRLLNIIS